MIESASCEFMMNREELRARLHQIRHRMARAAERVGRDPASMTLLGAAKTVDPERIGMAIELGVTHIGENRVQEAQAKFEQVPSLRQAAVWHMIGHLQTNKARRAIELFDVIQSIDSVRLTERLERVAGDLNRRVSVYIEVNVGVEESKYGVSSDHLLPLVEAVADCPHLRFEGLMTMPPYVEDPESARPYFRKLRELLAMVKAQHLFSHEPTGLSMGMSHDFEVAIEEGATLIRLGQAIWGPRPDEQRMR